MKAKSRNRGPKKYRTPWPFRMMSDERGIAMPIAVIGLALLFLISMVIITLGISELNIGQMTKYSSRAQKIAEAGVNRALVQLRNEPGLSSPDTTNANNLNWPHQVLSGSPPAPTLVHRNNSFAGGKYETWLYQDPAAPSDHAKKVIVSYGAITQLGREYTRTIEAKVNYSAANPNYFDAFNFLVYNGNEDGGGAQDFSIANSFGSYSLDGIGSTGDGWGIYSVGDIKLNSYFLGAGCDVKGNVISESNVEIGGNIVSVWPVSVNGTVYAGIDGSGNCSVNTSWNFVQLNNLYVGKIYAADNVNVTSYLGVGPTLNGAVTIDKGFECGGKATISTVASGSIWGGGIHIGHPNRGPEDGIKARGGLEIYSFMTAIDLGDVWTGWFDKSGNMVGCNWDAQAFGTIVAGNVKSTGAVQFMPIFGGIVVGNTWAGTHNLGQDGWTFDTTGTVAVAGWLSLGNLVARGQVKIVQVAAGLDIDNIYAGYQTVSGKRISVDFTNVVGGFDVGNINAYGKVQGTIVAGGAGVGNINAGTAAVNGNGDTGVELDTYVGGTGCGNIMSRGKTDIDTWLGGVGAGNITAGTDNSGLHGGTGIEFKAQAGGGRMGSGTCVGKFVARAVAGGVTVSGNITAGTDSTTLLGGKGTGGDGINFFNTLGGITVTGNITSRGRVPLTQVAGFGITVQGNITAGTDRSSAPIGDGGTGVYIRTTLAAPIQVWGNITSRGMVDIGSVLSQVTAAYNPGTGVISTITAGTNSAALSGGEAVSISNTLDLGSIISWPDYGNIRGRGRVTVTATAGGVHVNGGIHAGYCDDVTWGRNGVMLSTSGLGGIQVGDYSAGGPYNGITSVGKVVLNCNGIAGYFNSMDIAGKITAGTDAVAGAGGTGVDIRPSALGVNIGSAGTGGIDSTGRTNLTTSWGQGINVRGACKIGTDSALGRNRGLSMLINSSADILWGGVTVSGLIEASSPVLVQSTISAQGVTTTGIYAGEDLDNLNSGYGVRLYSTAGSIDDNGTITTPSAVYIDQSWNGYIECGNITTGRPAATGIGVYVRYHESAAMKVIDLKGTVKTRGKLYATFSGVILWADVDLGSVEAGSQWGNTTDWGVELHGITGGTVTLDKCETYGRAYMEAWGIADFNYTLSNVWCGGAIDWSWDGWPDSNLNIYGYLRSAGDISLGVGNPGTDDIYCNVASGIQTGGTFTMKLNTNFYADGGINAVGGVSMDTWGETIRTGAITCGSMWFNMDDGSWQLNGNPALACQGNINLTPNQSISWGGVLRSQGSININTDGDETVSFGKIYGKTGIGINFDDGNWTLAGGVESQGSWSTYCGYQNEFLISSGGIWLGGALTFTCQTDAFLATEAGMRTYGGISCIGAVSIQIPREPDPSYYLGGGIKSMGNVTIDGNARADYADEWLVDSDGIHASGTVSINFASGRDGEWGYISGDVKSPGIVYSNARRNTGTCQSCVWPWSCANNDPADWDYLQVTGTIYRGTQSYSVNSGDTVGTCSKWTSFLSCGCNGAGRIKGGVTRVTDAAGVAGPTVTLPPNADFTVTPSGPGTPPMPATPANAINPPTLPLVHADVDNLVSAAVGGGDLPLPGEPNMPAFGGAYPAFPNMAAAATDLPAWMNYGVDVLTPGGAPGNGDPAVVRGEIPKLPSMPTWGTAAELKPDFDNLLPFGGATEVIFPRPQWDWWRQQAQSQGGSHYSANPGTTSITIAPTQDVSSDEVYFCEGNADITSVNFPNDAVVHKATIVTYGTGDPNQGNINVTTASTWKIYGKCELHLIAMHDVNINPGSVAGSFTIGDQAVFQMWAGNKITVALSYLSGILGSGTTRGNLIAGNKVELTDPFSIGVGWYRYSYYRPEIKADGWIIPYRTRGWRELTNRNWTNSTPSG